VIARLCGGANTFAPTTSYHNAFGETFTLQGSSFTSTSSQMLVTFSADAATEASGFIANFAFSMNFSFGLKRNFVYLLLICVFVSTCHQLHPPCFLLADCHLVSIKSLTPTSLRDTFRLIQNCFTTSFDWLRS
jgi:hypothetical protein